MTTVRMSRTVAPPSVRHAVLMFDMMNTHLVFVKLNDSDRANERSSMAEPSPEPRAGARRGTQGPPIAAIAAALRRERERTGMTLSEVARRAGVAKSTL